MTLRNCGHGFAPRIVCAVATVLVALTGSAAMAHNTGWKSGARNNNATTGFSSWSGASLGIISGWTDYRKGWAGMYAYASGRNPRTLKSKSPNVSFGHALFPRGGSVSACASGAYDANHREVARRLSANGAGDAEIRLGWEANGNWFAWTAVGKSADQWKQCFTRAANAFKSINGAFRIAWSMAKKGSIDARTIYPEEAPITNICLSHYDDAYDRFGLETHRGGPWGLQAWADFARSKGKKFCLGEWGVGRDGDNSTYIQQMHDFLERNVDIIAHEAYFNSSIYQLYPVGPNPKSSKLYQQLF